MTENRAPTGKRTKRMYKLEKLGLFVFLGTRRPNKKTAAATKKTATRTIAKVFHVKGAFSLSEAKNRQTEAEQQSVSWDGTALPDGWVPQLPGDPTLRVIGVRCVRMSDGSTLKLYKLTVCKEEVTKLRKAAKKKLQRIKRENEAAARRDAKRNARLMLHMLGKQI